MGGVVENSALTGPLETHGATKLNPFSGDRRPQKWVHFLGLFLKPPSKRTTAEIKFCDTVFRVCVYFRLGPDLGPNLGPQDLRFQGQEVEFFLALDAHFRCADRSW